MRSSYMLINLRLSRRYLIVVLVTIIISISLSSKTFAVCGVSYGSGSSGGAAGAAGGNGSIGGDGGCGLSGAGGGGGAGSGGSAAGGNGGNGAGGSLVLKNTSGSMTVSGTIDARGGSSSTTNGGTVKLFYTGSAPSTSGISSGRTYTAAATTQISSVCTPTVAADDSSVGTRTWSTTAGGLEQDGSLANSSSALGGNTISHYIKMTGCNFSIPSGATITGVKADFLRYGVNTPLGSTVGDNIIKLVKAGTVGGSSLASGTAWSTSATWDQYGGATNLWGNTLTPSDVNSINFGLVLSAAMPYDTGSGGSQANLDATHITVYYTVSTSNSAPAAPTLIAPSSGATGQAASPTFQFRTTDADNDYLKYKIIIYNSDCSTGAQTFDQTTDQTGWSGQDQQSSTAYTGSSTLSSSTIANFSGVTLSGSTQYCWKAAAIDPGGNNVFGSFSSTQLFTTAANSTPAAPTLVSPTSGATGVSTSPLLQLRTTDADNNYLRYKILLYNSDCSTGLQTFDQTSSQTGWSGQDQQSATAYTGNSVLTSSTVATYGAASLSANTQYCWKGAAIDPAGTNTFSSYSSTQLFTTGSAVVPVQLNGGTQIRGGTLIR